MLDCDKVTIRERALLWEMLNFVTELHQGFTDAGCKIEVKEAKSGYVASYLLNKKTVANYVFGMRTKQTLYQRFFAARACGQQLNIIPLPIMRTRF